MADRPQAASTTWTPYANVGTTSQADVDSKVAVTRPLLPLALLHFLSRSHSQAEQAAVIVVAPPPYSLAAHAAPPPNPPRP